MRQFTINEEDYYANVPIPDGWEVFDFRLPLDGEIIQLDTGNVMRATGYTLKFPVRILRRTKKPRQFTLTFDFLEYGGFPEASTCEFVMPLNEIGGPGIAYEIYPKGSDTPCRNIRLVKVERI